MTTPLETVRAQLARVPESPGVYLWKDAEGAVLYVGKAKRLRRRMQQYVSGHDTREKVPLLMAETASFDYIVTGNEVESLILESNLIKQFRPRYNVDYRDDKTYPFIALTLSNLFPAIKYTREKHKAGTRYFGPYTDAKAVRETIEVVRRIYPVCRADCVEWKRLTAKDGEPTGKPCFDFHVGKGPGPCVGAISREAYAARVEQVVSFLEGRTKGVAEALEREMRAASGELEFERAARLKRSADAVRKVLERQMVVSEKPLDMDVIGLVREETIAAVHLLAVREGRVLAGNEFVLDEGLEVEDADLVEGFLLRYYAEASHVPREVLVSTLPCEPEAAEEWLSRLRGTRVTVATPVRGNKRRLLDLACTNAKHTLNRYKFRTRYDELRTNEALLQLESALALPAPPLRIECYDISTLHGRHSVGSMVVFTAGQADSSQYRRFRIRLGTPEANDVAMMREVLGRRFAREAAEGKRFASRPDLLIVDGGKPQLGAAREVLRELGLTDIPLAALAKREEELFLQGWDEPVALPNGSASLYLVKRIRDEAHRFAVTYHRDLRGKAMTASALDDIPGVGPKRRKLLLRAFGSVKRLREASVEDIAATPGIPREVAETVHAYLTSE
ncbi:MAG TPA: excinuclease ABC subunit UvrC [Coriobacteriia bacterium]|jgi:excinuclease ABC subunit C